MLLLFKIGDIFNLTDMFSCKASLFTVSFNFIRPDQTVLFRLFSASLVTSHFPFWRTLIKITCPLWFIWFDFFYSHEVIKNGWGYLTCLGPRERHVQKEEKEKKNTGRTFPPFFFFQVWLLLFTFFFMQISEVQQ